MRGIANIWIRITQLVAVIKTHSMESLLIRATLDLMIDLTYSLRSKSSKIHRPVLYHKKFLLQQEISQEKYFKISLLVS